MKFDSISGAIIGRPQKEDARIDKLLWSLRVYKTRPMATDACDAGHVTIGEFAVRPGRKVHVGEIIRVRLPDLTRTLQLEAIPRSRIASKRFAEHATDLTPQTEYDKARQTGIERAAARARFSGGRPTNKDRRDWEKMNG